MAGQWEKERWTETMFKRLWWQGYSGRVGLFSWPDLSAVHFDQSEMRAWNSARALNKLIENLNQKYSVNILAHSQGNVVAGEAIRLSPSLTVINYIASQAAISANMYDSEVPEYLNDSEIRTPDIYGHFHSGESSSFPCMIDNSNKTNMISYFNEVDYALTKGPLGLNWEWDNRNKPNNLYYYEYNLDRYDPAAGDHFFYVGWVSSRDLTIPENTYEIFSYVAQSRSKALGAISPYLNNDPNQQICLLKYGNQHYNLQDIKYNEKHYSHSRQFRSNIVDEWKYWDLVIKDFKLNTNKSN